MSQAGGALPRVEMPAASDPVSPPDVDRARPVVTPLGPDRYQITFTGSGETRDMPELAKDMLRHAVPNADTAEVMNRALRALLEDLARKKFALTKRPRASRGEARSSESSRYLPPNVKREVWIRDHGRCGFIAAGGRRCNTRGFGRQRSRTAYGGHSRTRSRTSGLTTAKGADHRTMTARGHAASGRSA